MTDHLPNDDEEFVGLTRQQIADRMERDDEWLKEAERLLMDFGYKYAYVGDDTMPRAKAALLDHLRARPAAPLPDQIQQIVTALRTQQQADEDGVVVTVSRQACDEAAAILESRIAAPLPEPVAQESHLDFGVREDGTVEGWYVETYYRPCTGILTDHEHQCVRVVVDDEGYDLETRVLFSTLTSDGWIPPAAGPVAAPLPGALQDEHEAFAQAMVEAGYGKPERQNFRHDSLYLHGRDQDRFVGWQLARAALSAETKR